MYVYIFHCLQLDALEYIHSTGYVHCDIKAANLLYGYAKGTENNLFLVDFGLVCRFSVEKEFKKDPKKAHNGTIEYTSRDLHQGGMKIYFCDLIPFLQLLILLLLHKVLAFNFILIDI